ncbi:hypothetical protein QP487_13450, partial [Streptococcus pasteurianus]
YQLEAVVIGRVTDDRRYRLFHKGELVADVPVNALAEDAPEYEHAVIKPAYYQGQDQDQYHSQ